jgi:integral membrane sensor domain MASE1
VFNTWFTDWASQAIALLALEAVFFIVIGLPVFRHNFVRKKEPFKQSLSDSVQCVLSFLAGWV